MRIFLDVGHQGSINGYDPGAIGNTYKAKECDLNLKVALEVEKILKDYDCTVELDRKEDKKNSLADKVKLSNEFNADVFVSIHHNSFVNKNVKGLETYYFSTSKKGKSLAMLTQAKLNAINYTLNRGIKTGDNLYVIKNTNAPAILLELGFISNKEDEYYCINSYKRLAKAIAEALIEEYNISALPQDTFPFNGVITRGSNIRSNANGSSMIIGYASKENDVVVTDKIDNYYQIKFNSDLGEIKGYIFANYTTKKE